MVDLGVARVSKTGSEYPCPNIGQGACDAMSCLVAFMGVNTLDIVLCQSSIVACPFSKEPLT